MSSIETGYKHVMINQDNVPIIAGTKTKVVELVTEHYAYGWSPEEMHRQHPYLSLAQIHSAMAYYWEHQEEIDKDMFRRFEYSEQMRKKAGPSPIVARLKAQGLLK